MSDAFFLRREGNSKNDFKGGGVKNFWFSKAAKVKSIEGLSFFRLSFRIVSGESPETIRKLCLSTKFPHQEIR